MLVKLPEPQPYAKRYALVRSVGSHAPSIETVVILLAPTNGAKFLQPLAAKASPSRTPK